MSAEVTTEVWMRIAEAETMSFVGTITYTETELVDGVLSTDSFYASLTEFVAEVNEVLNARRLAMRLAEQVTS